VIESDSDNAGALQDFFSSVYTVEPDGEFDCLANMINKNHIKMSDCYKKDSVFCKLYNLNTSKSPGPDILHPRVLYESQDVIANPLKH